jgi:DNA-binding transcriptional regulator YiaG
MLSMENAKLRTIRRAAEALGSEKALADALGVRARDVASWLSGATVPNDAAYFAALDIGASGPLLGPRSSSSAR